MCRSLIYTETDLDRYCACRCPTTSYGTAFYNGHYYGPLTSYAKSQVVHAPGIPRTFPPPQRVSDPDMHHGTCVTHVPWCTPGSLTGGFLWSRWRGKRSRHSRRMHNPHIYVSGKRPIWGMTIYINVNCFRGSMIFVHTDKTDTRIIGVYGQIGNQ